MSAKSLRNQLLAAIAMVLVATIALGSSTYAWFANNNKVTAEGMSISAQSEGANLEISWTSSGFVAGQTTIGESDTGFDTTKYTNVELYPTHYLVADDVAEGAHFAGETAETWIHTFSSKYDEVYTDDYSNTAGVKSVVNPYGDNIATPVTTDYALVVPIYLQLNANSEGSINDIKATATITHGGAGQMTDAGRIAYIVGGELKGAGYKTGDVSDALCSITEAGTPVCVYAVIYFDGEDPTCTSAKYNADTFSVSISFEGTVATTTV